ncbi:hypothetical protein AAVH_27642, partial [Aphelenchoides avenae]
PYTIIVRPCLGHPDALRQLVRAMLHECIHVAIYTDRRGDTDDHGVNYHSYRSILELTCGLTIPNGQTLDYSLDSALTRRTPSHPTWTHLDWLNYWFNFRR